MPPSSQPRRVVRYEAQPTRMFGSYSVTVHYDDGSSDALVYGEAHYCLAEAKRRNAEIAALWPAESEFARDRPGCAVNFADIRRK